MLERAPQSISPKTVSPQHDECGYRRALTDCVCSVRDCQCCAGKAGLRQTMTLQYHKTVKYLVCDCDAMCVQLSSKQYPTDWWPWWRPKDNETLLREYSRRALYLHRGNRELVHSFATGLIHQSASRVDFSVKVRNAIMPARVCLPCHHQLDSKCIKSTHILAFLGALMSCVLHQLSCIAAVTAWRQTLPAQHAEASCLTMYVTELLICSHKIDTTCTREWTRAGTNSYSEENDQKTADMCKCLCCMYDVAQQPIYSIHFGMADTLSIYCIADQV